MKSIEFNFFISRKMPSMMNYQVYKIKVYFIMYVLDF